MSGKDSGPEGGREPVGNDLVHCRLWGVYVCVHATKASEGNEVSGVEILDLRGPRAFATSLLVSLG